MRQRNRNLEISFVEGIGQCGCLSLHSLTFSLATRTVGLSRLHSGTYVLAEGTHRLLRSLGCEREEAPSPGNFI